MGSKQREDERREDLKVFPLRWELKQQFPGSVVTGDGHYNEGDCGEQKEGGVELNAERGAVGYAQ